MAHRWSLIARWFARPKHRVGPAEVDSPGDATPPSEIVPASTVLALTIEDARLATVEGIREPQVAMPAWPRLEEATSSFLQKLAAGDYDFIDLGTCGAGGFDIAKHFGLQRGLGFDLDPYSVTRNLDAGLDVACFDVCALPADGPVVDAAILSHVLEHLPSLADIHTVIASCSMLARDFLCISGPTFEYTEYLASLGFQLLQNLMPDHTYFLRVGEIIGILHDLGRRDYLVALAERVDDSHSKWVYTSDQNASFQMAGLFYDENRHLPKERVSFDAEVYMYFVVIVPLRAGIDADAILDRYVMGYDKIVDRSCWRSAAASLAPLQGV